MPTRTHYLPIENASAGMVLAESVKDTFQRAVLPGGSTLTPNSKSMSPHTPIILTRTNLSAAGQRHPTATTS